MSKDSGDNKTVKIIDSDSDNDSVQSNTEIKLVKDTSTEKFKPKPKQRYDDNANFSDDDLDLDSFANSKNMRDPDDFDRTNVSYERTQPKYVEPIYQKANAPRPNLHVNFDDDEDDETDGGSRDDYETDNASVESIRSNTSLESDYDESSDEILRKKEQLLFKLKRYESKGMSLRKIYSMNTPYSELKAEVETIRKQYRMDSGVALCKKALVTIVSGIEFLNHKFDPFDLELDGWSQNVHENQDDYDEVFEDLYEKYADRVDVAPEIKLMLMVGGSAISFHLMQTMLKKGTINPTMMNFLGGMGGGNGGVPMQQQRPPANAPQPNRFPPGMRHEMKGPDGVDDILKEMNLNN